VTGPAYDSIEAWRSEPTLLGFDHVHPELVGAVPTEIYEGEGVPMRTFIGLKDFAGWRFTMEPAKNAAGSDGFMRADIRQSDATIARCNASAAIAEENHAHDLAAHCRRLAEPRPPEWFEANWLTQWLKAGLIREVTDV